MSKVLKNDCFSYSRRLPEHKSQERDFGQKSRRMVCAYDTIGKKLTYKRNERWAMSLQNCQISAEDQCAGRSKLLGAKSSAPLVLYFLVEKLMFSFMDQTRGARAIIMPSLTFMSFAKFKSQAHFKNWRSAILPAIFLAIMSQCCSIIGGWDLFAARLEQQSWRNTIHLLWQGR